MSAARASARCCRTAVERAHLRSRLHTAIAAQLLAALLGGGKRFCHRFPLTGGDAMKARVGEKPAVRVSDRPTLASQGIDKNPIPAL
jgi:hypothetical protein